MGYLPYTELIIFLFLLIVVIVLAKPYLKKEWKYRFYYLGIFIFFGIIYFYFIPHRFRVLSDEFDLMYRGFDSGFTSYKSPLTVVLYKIILIVSNSNAESVISFNIIIALLNLVLLFAIVKILYDKNAALIAALLLGMNVVFMINATSAYTMNLSIFFLFISFLLSLYYVASRRKIVLIAALFSSTLIALNRIEFILIMPFITLYLLITTISFKKLKSALPIIILSIIIFTPMFFLHNLPIYQVKQSEMLGFENTHLYVSNILKNFNLLSFKLFFLGFFIIVSQILITKFAFMKKRNLIWFGLLPLGLIFSTLNNISPWYTVVLYIPFIIGVSILLSKLLQIERLRLNILFSILFFFFFLFLLFHNVIYSERIYYADEYILHFDTLSTYVYSNLIHYIPENSILITVYIPDVLDIHHRLRLFDLSYGWNGLGSSLNKSDLNNTLLNFSNNNETIYFYENYVCSLNFYDGPYDENCREFIKTYNLIPKVIFTYNLESNFTLYEVTLNKSVYNNKNNSVEIVDIKTKDSYVQRKNWLFSLIEKSVFNIIP